MASNYSPTTWTNGSGQPVSDSNLNKIEGAMESASDGAFIKQWYEAEADTNAYTDVEKAQLATNISNIATLDGRVTSIESSHTVLLSAASTATSQQPTGLDTALQVEFGALQTTTDIDIAADGAITFKTAGKYIVVAFFQYGRIGASGVSVLMNRYLLNGTQAGNSLASKVDNADVLVPWSSSVQLTVGVNDVLTIEIIRDSAGGDSGGLFSVTPTPIGWNTAPCAAIQIYKAI